MIGVYMHHTFRTDPLSSDPPSRARTQLVKQVDQFMALKVSYVS